MYVAFGTKRVISFPIYVAFSLPPDARTRPTAARRLATGLCRNIHQYLTKLCLVQQLSLNKRAQRGTYTTPRPTSGGGASRNSHQYSHDCSLHIQECVNSVTRRAGIGCQHFEGRSCRVGNLATGDAVTIDICSLTSCAELVRQRNQTTSCTHPQASP